MPATHRVAALLAAFALPGCATARHAGESPCLTESAQGAQYVLYVERELAYLDSAGSVRLGLPPGVDVPVTLVADPATCAAAVRGINAGLAIPDGDPHRVRRAYVMAIGASAYAAVDEPTASRGGQVYVFLDARFRWLWAAAAIQ